MKEEEAIKRRFKLVAGELNERTRRLVAASEAVAIGWGGISAVSRVTGLSRKAISHGVKELQKAGGAREGRIRRQGGGRKKTVSKDPRLVEDLERLVEPMTRGDPESPLRLWKWELQQLADETGLSLMVCHFPPGTSKWNKIEHRLFAWISQNWRGKPLISYTVILKLISATTTGADLTVQCQLDTNTYPAGHKVSNEEMASLSMLPHTFHGEWNYTILPRET